MENKNDNLKGIYEVEKIINSKMYRNKKYYLIKWLCYPINECTWEPKSSLKNLNNMIDAFESEYPYSIDKDMYNIYCEELQKRIKRKNRRKKNHKEFQLNTKFLHKKKKMEFFSSNELKDSYFDKLKIHLHLNMAKRHNKSQESEIVIELSSSTTESEVDTKNEKTEKDNSKVTEEKNNSNQLIMPQME